MGSQSRTPVSNWTATTFLVFRETDGRDNQTHKEKQQTSRRHSHHSEVLPIHCFQLEWWPCPPTTDWLSNQMRATPTIPSFWKIWAPRNLGKNPSQIQQQGPMDSCSPHSWIDKEWMNTENPHKGSVTKSKAIICHQKNPCMKNLLWHPKEMFKFPSLLFLVKFQMTVTLQSGILLPVENYDCSI